MEHIVYRNRYAVVHKAPNWALYGRNAKPEYYIHCWDEEVPWQECEGWTDDEWVQFYAEQNKEYLEAYDELRRLQAQA